MTRMDENRATEPESPEDDEILRKRLLKRVAIAAAAVVVLLGGLVAFDSVMVGEEEKPAELAREEPPARQIGTKVDEEAAPQYDGQQAQNQDQAEEKVADVADSADVVSAPEAEPERTEAPTAELRAERPLTIPAQARKAMVQSDESSAEPQRTVKETTVAPVVQAPARPAKASQPIASAAANAVRRILVQVGVFNNISNAEELRAKIEAAGLPVGIETRVRVGPFASRQEAEQAREKLKSLGLDPGLIVTARK